ncbi:5225_t:CDS:2 [Diversispora eburnea]|uniref:5225_t:CDS:1 n=1 Tax=Diversispora eburnea TaxID=1213867 RepID=A0A9N8ZAD1_9GLOM|nr:5225_t:CDS:2 [Diversispora eburnea]
MNTTTKTNNAGHSNITLRRDRSSRKINTTSEAERNGESSSLGKRKAVEDEDTKGKKKATKKRKGVERRAARYIKDCSDDTKKQIERAVKEPMYLIDCKEVNPTQRKYVVLGPTGEVYTTDIAKIVSCSCPDFHNGIHCKHILFILLRILKVHPESDLVYQKALKEKELKLIFNNSPQITYPSKGIVDQLKAIASRDQKKRKPIDDDCSCCHEPLGNQKVLIWCDACGNNIHLDCFTTWERSLRVEQKVK